MKLLLIYFIIILIFRRVIGDGSVCESVECGDDSLEPGKCPEGTFFDPLGSKDGCCPGCRGGKGEF